MFAKVIGLRFCRLLDLEQDKRANKTMDKMVTLRFPQNNSIQTNRDKIIFFDLYNYNSMRIFFVNLSKCNGISSNYF